MVVRWAGWTFEIWLLKLWPSQSVQHLIIQLQRSQQLGWASQARVSSTANRDNKSQGKYIFFRNLISNFNG